MQLLPLLQDNSSFEYVVSLDGTSFRFTLEWFDRSAGWYLTLATLDGEVILRQVRLAHDWWLWIRNRDPRLPAGQVFVLDRLNTGREPTFASLGRSTVLVYYTAADVAAALQSAPKLDLAIDFIGVMAIVP